MAQEPSERQVAIYGAWENTNNNLLVNAVAGSGKTTTVIGLVERSRHKTLFLAFNKSIQEEIQYKLESKGLAQGKAMTVHSLGLKALYKNYRGVEIKKGKNFDLFRQVEYNYKGTIKKLDFPEKLNLMYCLMDMNDVSRMFLTDDLEKIRALMITMDKVNNYHPKMQTLWNEFVRLRNKSYEGNRIIVDFLDMIYLPVIKKLEIPIDPYYLMIDECQDLNLCQHKLIDILINQSVVKWVAVGDEKQSIYGFAGATSNSFDLFREKENVVELPLDVCYRCAPNIIEEANQIYDIMEAHKEVDGVVETTSYIQGIEAGSMIICRNTSPLISLFFELISLGKPAFIKGDDIIGSIKKFLKPYQFMSITRAKSEMMNHLINLQTSDTPQTGFKAFKFKENMKNFELIALHLCDNSGTVKGLVEQIDSIFQSQQGAIMLCTIHKSKGLEANTVYILNEALIPSKFATSNEQKVQENNLLYVARTRAKEKLYYLNLD